jgi:hypothetical protein
MSQRSVDRLSLEGSEAYLQAEIQTIISNDTPRQSKHDQRWKQPAGRDCRKKSESVMADRSTLIIALRTDVYRLSPGLSAKYLLSGIQNSISSESPHDAGPDEQCQAQVKGQCRGKIRTNTSGQLHHTMSQRSVDRLSLGSGAAYLPTGIQNSISQDIPHDGGPDEQCQAHVECQYHEKTNYDR